MRQSATDPHDHAMHIAAEHGVGLTEIRRHVFGLVLKAEQPVGAYQLMEEMRAGGNRVMPPTVYRALNFLLAKGLVHRVESMNAFVACTRLEAEHQEQFLICTECGRTEELADQGVSDILRATAETRGFTLTHQTIELRGQCAQCRAAAA